MGQDFTDVCRCGKKYVVEVTVQAEKDRYLELSYTDACMDCTYKSV